MKANQEVKGPQLFARWLRRKMRESGLTVPQLAEASGVPEDIISYRRGRCLVRNPEPKTRKAIAAIGRALGSEDEALLVAGFAPDGLLEALQSDTAYPLVLPEAIFAFAAVAGLSAEEREGVQVFLRAAISGVRAQRQEVA